MRFDAGDADAGETELDEAFFPILWLDGYRTPWLVEYGSAQVPV